MIESADKRAPLSIVRPTKPHDSAATGPGGGSLNDAIAASLDRQSERYRRDPRSIPGYGSDQPQGIEEQYRAAARERRRRESGVPE